MVAQPFRESADDYFAKACGVGLTALFFFAFVLKVGVLAEATESVLTEQLALQFGLDAGVLAVCMAGAVVSVLGLTAAVTAFQLLAAARKPILRLTTTNSAPELPLAPHQHWHLFLSHVWRTAQDSCNAIKRNLQLLLPGVSIFLDTDDIGGAVGDLEKHVDAAAVVNIFVSKGYFMSKNCLRTVWMASRRQFLLMK